MESIITPDVDTAQANTCQHTTLQWRVKTKRLQHLGIQPGDELVLELPARLHEGSWLLLCFNDRYYLRQLSLQEDHFLLSPLAGDQQPMAWPQHQPLPLVGCVVAVHRQIGAR